MDEAALQQALTDTQNLGEMPDADAVGTVGSPDCGDMVRMWIKYKEKDGKKVIDKASFQSFGCQTAIAVASIATELIRGKTKEEALSLSAEELSKPLGPLPPMKIHCGQMVEGALRQALEADRTGEKRPETAPTQQGTVDDSTLLGRLSNPNPDAPKGGKLKIVKLDS